ncbi:Angio-associated migratory cell protein [Auxenochlorella protothecoides]|uniref:Angio-associated migratory cell protein n=1 Tax=Auxenochlorella protothecoides TaxID=3075 RepID=A0A087SJT0_AUXPR|nr:Angio-associated migratory cell protein [Auxenochlorella protothecoides]KFM25984.1 Angio-associated migratory cell protein [Auxenochlorella protothecoides]
MAREPEEAQFIGVAEGDIGDAQEVHDLDDGDQGGISDSSDDEAGSTGVDAAEYEDDSIHTFEGHQDGVYAVAWCPTKKDLVATGGADDKAFLWRVGHDAFEETGGAFFQLDGHEDTVASLAFNHDGSLLASGGMDGVVKVWDTETGACLQTLDGPGDAVEWVAWHPRGDVVLAGTADFSAWMWEGRRGAWMATFSGHTAPVAAGAFTPDGRAVVTAGGEGDASLRVWDPRSGACTASVSGHPFHAAGVTCLALSPDGASALTGSEDGAAKVVSLGTGRVGATLVTDPARPGHEDQGERAGVEAPLVFTACMDGAVRAWDARSGRCNACFRGHEAPVQDLAVSPDGKLVLAGAEDGAARVFSLEEGIARMVAEQGQRPEP